MVKYKNLEGSFQNHIVSSVEWALQTLNQITDVKLRNCIKKKLEKDGTIRIRRTPVDDHEKPESHDCYTNSNLGGQNKSFGFGKHRIYSNEITLCVDNLNEMDKLNLLFDYILHEFAHSCGWEHGDCKGVPFPDGYPDET